MQLKHKRCSSQNEKVIREETSSHTLRYVYMCVCFCSCAIQRSCQPHIKINDKSVGKAATTLHYCHVVNGPVLSCCHSDNQMAKASEQMEVRRPLEWWRGGYFGNRQPWLMLLKHLICSSGCRLIYTGDCIFRGVWSSLSGEDGGLYTGKEMAELSERVWNLWSQESWSFLSFLSLTLIKKRCRRRPDWFQQTNSSNLENMLVKPSFSGSHGHLQVWWSFNKMIEIV